MSTFRPLITLPVIPQQRQRLIADAREDARDFARAGALVAAREARACIDWIRELSPAAVVDLYQRMSAAGLLRDPA